MSRTLMPPKKRRTLKTTLFRSGEGNVSMLKEIFCIFSYGRVLCRLKTVHVY